MNLIGTFYTITTMVDQLCFTIATTCVFENRLVDVYVPKEHPTLYSLLQSNREMYAGRPNLWSHYATSSFAILVESVET
jgi:hypothetical protein